MESAIRRALVVGHAGQDGRILCEQLEQSGWLVSGTSRSTSYSTEVGHTRGPSVDITAPTEVEELVRQLQPSVIYYLAAYHESSEGGSGGRPADEFRKSYVVHVDGLLNFLQAVAMHQPRARVFNASSSLIFSAEKGDVQDEESPFVPNGFYGITKAQSVWLCREFRQRHAVFASSGILYNHESEFRPEKYLSAKIVRAAVKASLGQKTRVVVGDLTALVDWGYAPDFVDAFQRIMALDQADDFIVATGEAHSVKEMAEIAFGHLGLDWAEYVSEDPSILSRRPGTKIGDNRKLREATGWMPTLSFREMVVKLVCDTRKHIEDDSADT